MRNNNWFSRPSVVCYVLMVAIILVCNIETTQADKLRIDSLKMELQHNLPDSLITRLYSDIAEQWESLDSDSSIMYYDKALKMLADGDQIESKAKLYNKLGGIYFYKLKSEDAIDYFNKSLRFSEKANLKEEMLEARYNIAYYYSRFENYTKSIENFKKAADLALELNNEARLAYIYNNLGLMYHYSGIYDKAIAYNIKSLELKEKIGDQTIGLNHVNMALSYLKQENFDKAFEHDFIALTIFTKADKKSHIAFTYKNIGDLHSEINQLDSAQYYYNNSFDYYKELDDKTSLSRLYMVIGNIDKKQGHINMASQKYNKALEELPENGSQKLLYAIYSNIAELNLELAASDNSTKEFYLEKASAFAQKMYTIAHNIKSLNREVESYKKLYRSNLESGKNHQALQCADAYIMLSDSLYSEQKQKAILDLQTKYETEKKEYEIEFLNKENDLISDKLSQSELLQRKQRTIILLLIAGILIFCVLIFIIFRFYLKSKQANKDLLEKNTIITQQKKEKELLVKETHHRVKNNLQIISSLFDLQLRNSTNAQVQSALLDGMNRVKSVAIIHELLHQNNNGIHIEFHEFIKKLLTHIQASFDYSADLNQSINIPQDLQFNIETSIPLGLIINELITNAYKYGNEDNRSCFFSINLSVQNKQYHLELKDNGPGLPEEFDFNTSKTLGLKMVHTLTKQLKGNMKYEYDNGAKFVFEFKA
ncbi:MAG: tetratricopeptide repeat protein [Bacteroidales bacterium]|nr:tetratricopeptide repeat protein [Bacteroidales bacterium]